MNPGILLTIGLSTSAEETVEQTNFFNEFLDPELEREFREYHLVWLARTVDVDLYG